MSDHFFTETAGALISHHFIKKELCNLMLFGDSMAKELLHKFMVTKFMTVLDDQLQCFRTRDVVDLGKRTPDSINPLTHLSAIRVLRLRITSVSVFNVSALVELFSHGCNCVPLDPRVI